MKIGIVIPYFGSWPSYFDFFLRGCEANQWLDIIFFTDCAIPVNQSPNVTFHRATLADMSKLASEKLGFELVLQNAYKICDLKPFYGIVFSDYLTGYHYWGYGDIDLIYGDLKPFVIPRIRDGFDILSSRQELVSGSFAVFKNNYETNRLCEKIPGYQNRLKSKKYECIDETGHSNIVWQGGSKADLPNHCFTKVVADASLSNRLKVSFETICKEHISSGEVIQYENFELYFDKKPLGYYHYVINKNNPVFKIPKWKTIPEKFVITYSGFYKPEDLKYFPVIKNYRKMKGHSVAFFWRVFRKLRREFDGVVLNKS